MAWPIPTPRRESRAGKAPMPEDNAEVTAAIAAERERVLYLLSVFARNPRHVQSRVFTAVSGGYTREECERRWPGDFAL